MAESPENTETGSESDIDDVVDDDTSKPVSKPQKSKAKVTKKAIVKPSMYSMVIDALKAMDNNIITKKGVSVQALKDFIINKYKVDHNDAMKNGLKAALRRGLKEGTIMRPKPYAVKLTGRFRYDKKKKERKKPIKAAKAAKSPKPKSTKKAAPKKDLLEEMEKEKKKTAKAKDSPKKKEKPKTATKKKATPKKKTVSKMIAE